MPFVTAQNKIWTEKQILTNGIPFLKQQKKEMKTIHEWWDSVSTESNFYTAGSKVLAHNLKDRAEIYRKQTEALQEAVIKLLMTKYEKTPLDANAQKLAKISIATFHGMNYFKSVVDDYYPTPLNQRIRDITTLTNKTAFCVSLLTGAIYSSNLLFVHDLPWFTLIPAKISLSACLCLSSLSYLNKKYRINSAEQQVITMEKLFRSSLTQAAA